MAIVEINARRVVADVYSLGLSRIAGHCVLPSRGLGRQRRDADLQVSVAMVLGTQVTKLEFGIVSRFLFSNHAPRLARTLPGMRS